MKFRPAPKKFRIRLLNPSPSAKRFSTVYRMYQAGRSRIDYHFLFVYAPPEKKYWKTQAVAKWDRMIIEGAELALMGDYHPDHDLQNKNAGNGAGKPESEIIGIIEIKKRQTGRTHARRLAEALQNNTPSGYPGSNQ